MYEYSDHLVVYGGSWMMRYSNIKCIAAILSMEISMNAYVVTFRDGLCNRIKFILVWSQSDNYFSVCIYIVMHLRILALDDQNKFFGVCIGNGTLGLQLHWIATWSDCCECEPSVLCYQYKQQKAAAYLMHICICILYIWVVLRNCDPLLCHGCQKVKIFQIIAENIPNNNNINVHMMVCM